MSPWKWWISMVGSALIVGGVAWLSELWVIVATDGRVVATGSAATFLELGLALLIVGSTGIGVRLMMNQEPSMRVVLAVASPLVLLGVGYVVGGVIGYAIFVVGSALAGVAVPGYLLAESAILGLARIIHERSLEVCSVPRKGAEYPKCRPIWAIAGRTSELDLDTNPI